MSRLKKALQKAELRMNQDVAEQPVSEREALENEIRKLLSDSNPEILHNVQKHIRLSYTQTKVIPSKPQTLCKNHVLTHLHDLEMADQMGLLRTQILTKLESMKGNCLLVTSANPGEGKTFVALNLGISIAQKLDRTVLLVDADLRHRTYTHYDIEKSLFDYNGRAGLADYLLGLGKIENLLINPGIERLTVLPRGKALPRSAEFLGSGIMEALVKDMKSRYAKERVIIIDSPSFLSVSDPLILAKYVDAVLLVVESEKTTSKELQRMLDLFKNHAIVGTVFNKCKDRIKSSPAEGLSFSNRFKRLFKEITHFAQRSARTSME